MFKAFVFCAVGVLCVLVSADAWAPIHANVRVPEPGSLSMVAVALLGGIAAYRLRRRK